MVANNSPVAVADNITAYEDGRGYTDVLANDTDANGDELTITSVDTNTGIIDFILTRTHALVEATTTAGALEVAKAVDYIIDHNNASVESGSIAYAFDSFATAEEVDAALQDFSELTEIAEIINEGGSTTDLAAALLLLSDETIRSIIPTFNTELIYVGDVPGYGIPGVIDYNVYNGVVGYTPGGHFEYLSAGETATDTFTYTVSDGKGGTDTATVNVTIIGENDAPTDVSLSNSEVNENTAGAIIGNLTTADVDTNDAHTYTVDDERFEVVVNEEGIAQLKLKDGVSLNHEDPDGNGYDFGFGDAIITVGVTAADSGGFSVSKSFDVIVNDINEAPTNIYLLENLEVFDNFNDIKVSDPVDEETINILGIHENLQIDENLTTGTAIARFAVSDEDSNDFEGLSLEEIQQILTSLNHTYTLIDDAGGLFEIRTTTNGRLYQELVLVGTLDYETAESHTITIKATDRGGLSYTKDFNIILNDVNDAPIAQNDSATVNASGSAGYALNVLENDSDDEGDVLSISSIDTTGTKGKTTKVTVTNSATHDVTIQTYNGPVIIHPSQTINLITYSPDSKFGYLAKGETATDIFKYTISDGNGGESTATSTITINGVNDAPTDITITKVANFENVSGAVYGALDALDIDTSDIHTFTVNDARFEVVGGNLKLKDGASLDFSSVPYVVLNVTATDPYGLSRTEQFAVDASGIKQTPIAVNDVLTIKESDYPAPLNIIPSGSTTGTITTSGIITVTGSIIPAVSFIPTPSIPTIINTVTIGSSNTTSGSIISVGTVAPSSSITASIPTITTGTIILNTGTIGNSNTTSGLITLTGTPSTSSILTGTPIPLSFTPATSIPTGNIYTISPMSSSGSITTGNAVTLSTNTTPGTITVAGSTILPGSATATTTGVITTTGTAIGINSGKTINVLQNDIGTQDRLHIDSLDTSQTTGRAYLITNTSLGNQSIQYDTNGKFEYLGEGEIATDTVKYTLSDGKGNTSVGHVTITITGENDAPVIANQVASQSAKAGNTWNYTIPSDAFSDVDGDALTYSAKLSDGSNLPSWLSFNSATRTFSGTPASGAAFALSIMVAASDDSLSASQTFDLNIASNIINGTSGSEAIKGTSINDEIHGLSGNDTLRGGAGADILDGGLGLDTASYTDSTAGVNVNLTTGVNKGGYAEGDTLIDIEYIGGTNYNDTLTGDSKANVLYGNTGNDVLSGMEGNDRILAGDGNDTLRGGAGADILDGGLGVDTASYTDSTAGVNVNLTTGVNKGGYAEGDTLISIEYVGGTNFNDVLTGDSKYNVLYGNAGDDIMYGMGGGDFLRADSGNDALYGGADADTLTGGSGSDSFNYSFLSDSTSSAYDAITDFQDGVDKINLHDLASAGIVDFSDLDITNDGVTTIISANDNNIDFEIHLNGVHNIQNSDIVW